MKVAFFDAKPYDIEWFTRMNEPFAYEIKFFKLKLNSDTALLTEGFDVVCAFVNDDISKEVLIVLEKNGIRLLVMRCAGYNNVDLSAAFGRVHVVRVPSYSPHSVAEHASALLLSLVRNTHRAYNRTRDGNFTLSGLVGFDLYGKTLGIIGTGKIGKIFAQILHGFGMNVLAYDKFEDAAWAKENNITYTDLETLYKKSNVISLHCPLVPENHHMIDYKAIELMPKGVIIINTGRGGLLHSQALIDGLKSGKIGGAGLDVYEEEDKYFFEDFSSEVITDDILARLLSFPNVLVTSHQAFLTREALEEIAKTSLKNIDLFFNQNELPNEICYQCSKGTCPRKETGHCFTTMKKK